MSGSEDGNLLLWEGNFIKCVINTPGGKKAHEGNIECIELLTDEGRFLTAGVDGWLRWWSFEMIDAADIDDEDPIYEIEPLAEIFISMDRTARTEGEVVEGGVGDATS